ncbi:TPA: type VI secretion system protein TssA [Pseudomonas putida]
MYLNHLAEPLTADAPCGESLEYDADYLALEEEAQGKPEIEYGNTLTQATAPDWKRVQQLALALATRSRDLRLATHLTRAELNLNGLPGLTAGLVLIETLLAEHWGHLHPQLDPDDDHDPQLRVNTLASLCEAAGLLHDLRTTPLVDAAPLGSVSLRDIDLANGEASAASDPQSPSLAMIEAVFQQAAPERVVETLATLELAWHSSQRIESLLTEHVGFASAIDLSALSTTLRRAADVLLQRLPATPTDTPQAATPEARASVASPRGEIASREDVRQTLDRLCAYFAVHEPGSPVPLLLQRARKLLELNFIELLQDLAPDGLAQMAMVSGLRDDSRSDD